MLAENISPRAALELQNAKFIPCSSLFSNPQLQLKTIITLCFSCLTSRICLAHNENMSYVVMGPESRANGEGQHHAKRCHLQESILKLTIP